MAGSALVRLTWALAFLGGYCDAASFLLVGTFTGHVTGNFVLSAVKLATGDVRGAFGSLLAIACFLAGTVLGVLLVTWFAPRSARFIFRVMFCLQILLVLIGWLFLRSEMAGSAELYLVVMALALSLQNGAVRNAGGVGVHTTFLTGMLTTLIAGSVSPKGSSTGEAGSHSMPATRVLGGIWFGFVAGAMFGAVVVFRYHANGVLGAAALLLILLVTLPAGFSARGLSQ